MKEDLEKDVQLVMEGDEEYSSRPKTKPAQAIKGKMLIWPETKQYYFEGRKEHPEMKREVMHDKGGVKIAKTVGEKESSYILTAKCPGDVHDFESLLCHKVVDSLKGRMKNEPQFSKPQYLIDRPEQLQAWIRKKEKKLRCLMTIDLSRSPESAFIKLSELTAEINKLIYNSKNLIK
ncbi:MAG: hypothetical protein K6E15_12740 [Prevotella sp.]|nr:hypothetical protein [Prevotella sp.]